MRMLLNIIWLVLADTAPSVGRPVEGAIDVGSATH
jgi:hypothetical protein